ncbi:MAG: aminotransferase class III, partial [Bacteroidetes bacterium RIFOXYA12_FULL_33_9]
LNNIYFVNSGSEAIEGAMKLAKRYTGKSKIFSFKNAYHGSTHGALSIMGDEKMKQSFRPLLPEVYHLNFNSFDDIELIDDKTACVIIEPVQAEAGIIEPRRGFLNALREKCNQTQTLLIFDEVQTGLGRTGKMFAFEKYGVIPDVLVLAKGMGGGMPLGAFVSSKDIMSVFKSNPILGHITTFGGHPVSCAAALETLNVLLDEKIIEDVERKSELFCNYLSHSGIKEIRRSGLMIAVQLDSFETVQKIVHECIKMGVIVDWFLFSDASLRIAPPLIISDDEIFKACNIISKAIDIALNQNV